MVTFVHSDWWVLFNFVRLIAMNNATIGGDLNFSFSLLADAVNKLGNFPCLTQVKL